MDLIDNVSKLATTLITGKVVASPESGNIETKADLE